MLWQAPSWREIRFSKEERREMLLEKSCEKMSRSFKKHPIIKDNGKSKKKGKKIAKDMDDEYLNWWKKSYYRK